MPDQLLYTVPEACQALRISRSILYELMRRRDLCPIKIGGRTYLARAELERYVRTLQYAAHSADAEALARAAEQ